MSKDEVNQQELTKKSTFNGVIQNSLPKITGEVIELSDSPSIEPSQDLLAELPQLSIYNLDKKYYTPPASLYFLQKLTAQIFPDDPVP